MVLPLCKKGEQRSPNGINQCFRKKALSALLAGLFLFSSTLTAPARAGLFSFDIKDEMELGRQFDILVRSQMPLVQDPEVQGYVENMLERLLSQAPQQPFPFKVAVLRHNAVNAFAAPGGYLFIHTGLIANMDSESELAGVLAHEIAHATQRHVASRIEKMQKISMISMAVALAGAVLGAGSGKGAIAAGAVAAGQSAMLNYSRADEDDSDQIGLKYLSGAGYSPKGMIGAFNKLRRKQWYSGLEVPTYLSTHPGIIDRITELEARIANLPKAVRERKDDNSRFWRVQSLILARYADPDVAINRFDDIIGNLEVTKSPEYKARSCLALMGKGIVLSRQNKINKAGDYFDKALVCSPNDELIIREAGRFHYYKGDIAKAEEYLSKATRMDSRDIMALFFYARLKSDQGKHSEAIELFQDVLRHLPQDAEVHEAYARALGKGGELFKAHLHLAYSALYSNDLKKTKKQIEQLKKLASTPQDQEQMERLEKNMTERAKFL